MMISNRHSERACLVYLYASLLAVCWIAGMPTEAGAQPAANVPTELISRNQIVPDRDFGRASDSLVQSLGPSMQASAPGPSPAPNSPMARRDSIKNGLLIGAAVVATLGVLSWGIADCPDSAKDPDAAKGRCPGAKALGLAVAVATGAAIGAGIDLLFAVDPGPGGTTRAGARRGILVSGRIRW